MGRRIMEIRFYLYIFAFTLSLHSIIHCAAQDSCSINKEPSIDFINETSIGIAASSVTAYPNTSIMAKIEYWHINYLGCVNKNESDGTVNMKYLTERYNTIKDLIPYSQYGTEISYLEGALSCTKKIIFNTTSDTLSDKEIPMITHKYSETEAFVSIKWKCQNLRGPILRNIGEITCVGQSCEGSTVDYNKSETTVTTDISFRITKQTKYTLKFNYQRGDVKRFEEYIIIINLQVPHEVRNIEAYNVNDTSVSLRWLPPDPPTGDIELYEIRYYHENDTNEVKVDGSSNCEIWTGFICTTIYDSKFLNRTYNFEIRAKNRHSDEFGHFNFFNLSTNRERVPSQPLNINYVWNERNLFIEWQHPDVPNGQIYQFYININRELYLTYDVKKERQNYNYEVDISNYNLISKKLFIEVVAANGIGNSSLGLNLIKNPRFLKSPTLENLTDSKVDITFSTVEDVEGDISKLYVIMTDLESPIKHGELHPRERELFEKIGANEEYSWTVGEFNLKNITELTVGNNTESVSDIDHKWQFFNRILERNHSYNVTFLLIDIYSGITKDYVQYTHYTTGFKTLAMKESIIEVGNSGNNDNNDDDYNGYNSLWSLLLVPVLLGFVCAVIIKRRRLNRRLPTIYTIQDNIGIYDKIVLNDRDFMKLVKIQELDEYIKSSIENEELTKQYNLLPKGSIKLHNDGSQLPNRAKNRYPDLVAYDATRVKLKLIEGDEFSDYINANYIDGYNSEKTYIATQTPTDNTYGDFWRMIWQENVKYIIIAADLNEEETERSSGIYWPSINDPLDFDDIRVAYRNIEVMANYEIRHFSLHREHEKRIVQQLHFFSMPDYSRVPLYIHSLASFVRKVLSISEEKSPIVVHCSNGISYTGMLILCDICLRMAISERQTDVFFQLYKLRKQRINMISSAEEYKAVHFVLLRILECLKIPTETGVICDKTMDDTIETILSTKITQQLNYLEESSWQDKAMRDIDFLYDSIRSDRTTDLEEPPHSQVYRYSTVGDAKLFITTTIVDSFSTPSKFVVTPKPLNATLGVFWLFIIEKRINVVVSLNKLSLIADFENMFNPLPTLEVRCVNHKINEYFEIFTLYANKSSDKEDRIKVNIIHILGWQSNVIHPESPNNLIMAYEEMNRLGKTRRPILITCNDGIQACGLYVAMCFLIEKIKAEHVCDVCLAVKSIRQSRKEYVRSVEQFTFLYVCGLEYVRKFRMYSNFDQSPNEEPNLIEDAY